MKITIEFDSGTLKEPQQRALEQLLGLRGTPPVSITTKAEVRVAEQVATAPAVPDPKTLERIAPEDNPATGAVHVPPVPNAPAVMPSLAAMGFGQSQPSGAAPSVPAIPPIPGAPAAPATAGGRHP